MSNPAGLDLNCTHGFTAAGTAYCDECWRVLLERAEKAEAAIARVEALVSLYRNRRRRGADVYVSVLLDELEATLAEKEA